MRDAPLLQKVDAVTVRLPGGDTELVLSTGLEYAANWLVASAEEAARVIESAGGTVIGGPFEIPVGRVMIAADPFGNALVLVDMSKGLYVTGADGRVTGVAPGDAR